MLEGSACKVRQTPLTIQYSIRVLSHSIPHIGKARRLAPPTTLYNGHLTCRLSRKTRMLTMPMSIKYVIKSKVSEASPTQCTLQCLANTYIKSKD